MARVELTVNVFTRAALADPTGQSVTAANDAMVVNDGKTVVRIANASGSTANLSFETPITVTGLAVADETAALNTANTAWYGPWETNIFNQTSGADAGKVYINTDQTVTVTAFRMP